MNLGKDYRPFGLFHSVLLPPYYAWLFHIVTWLHPSPLHAVRLAPQPSHQISRWLSSLHIWLHFRSFVLLQLHLVLTKIFNIQQMQIKLLEDFLSLGSYFSMQHQVCRFGVDIFNNTIHSCWNICVRIVLQCKFSMVQLSSICMPDFNSLSLVTLAVNLVLSLIKIFYLKESLINCRVL